MIEQALPLHIHIARDVFGWEWQADWQAWCLLGWPSRTRIGLWHGQRYQEQLLALKRHGGARSSLGGSLDDRGKPIIPDYQYDPEAAEILFFSH
jgi:hypothetical protein